MRKIVAYGLSLMADGARSYSRPFLAFLTTICLVRIFEYTRIASRLFVDHPWQYELAGLFYDLWACFIYGFVFLLLYLLLFILKKQVAEWVMHVLNILFLTLYLSLLFVFSERTHPFDHEFFTRNISDSWTTSKQMLASGTAVYLPFIGYFLLYFSLYFAFFKKIDLKKVPLLVLMGFFIVSISTVNFAMPNPARFSSPAAYYLECNKFSFWVSDSYKYLLNKNKTAHYRMTDKELLAAIAYYQQERPFAFTSTQYPLLHENKSNDVLGNFFKLDPSTPPNIVILVVEGLSRDFSGENAYASSFTPFLDSLANKSLAWDNFLSTAPGTFAAHPAISGSLPYGRRGFSLINVMPDHLSLIKILRKNGYRTSFMIGFNPDFDNMGGYIRLQGTDLILKDYESKYKQMGVGAEGWSMGYPDDALYSRSFEVMDSIGKMPYLNIYHTGTTHMPYLFEQKPIYNKRFDEKMKTINVSPSIKRTLKACKEVLVTFMFSDDCIRKFFSDYAKRPEFGNTIFFITGDHHIGSFPSTGNIDDYHVPLIVYSPMLKGPGKFHSVNSHNNLAPTISALLFNNYKMSYVPKEVNWMGDVMDTCPSFRNIHSMPFMAWSREINDYIYKGYLLSEGKLYKLTPELLEEPVKNDTIKAHITRLLENFKIINNYVCDSNRIYPAGQDEVEGEKELLYSFAEPDNKTIFCMKQDTGLMPDFAIPGKYRYLYVETSADVLLSTPEIQGQPVFRLGIVDKKATELTYLYWSNRDIVLMTKGEYKPGVWNHISTNDMFALDGYRGHKNLVFELALFTQKPPMKLNMKDLKVSIYGVK